MNRDRLLRLTLTASHDDSAWKIADAKERLERALVEKLGEVLRSTGGNVTLTLELYKEDV